LGWYFLANRAQGRGFGPRRAFAEGVSSRGPCYQRGGEGVGLAVPNHRNQRFPGRWLRQFTARAHHHKSHNCHYLPPRGLRFCCEKDRHGLSHQTLPGVLTNTTPPVLCVIIASGFSKATPLLLLAAVIRTFAVSMTRRALPRAS
jgi:hypothetical protein